jgi:hypothetical protein
MPKIDRSTYSHVIDLRGKHNVDNYLRVGWEFMGTYAGLAPLGRGQTTLTYRLGWPRGAGEPVKPEIDEQQIGARSFRKLMYQLFLEVEMINIRKLAALDMALNSTQSILVEFAIGIVLPLLLGFFSIRAGLFGRVQTGREILIGFWLIGVGVNYIPLFIYVVLLARSGTVKEEGQRELVHAEGYSLQQMIIFIPFLVVCLQSCRKRVAALSRLMGSREGRRTPLRP